MTREAYVIRRDLDPPSGGPSYWSGDRWSTEEDAARYRDRNAARHVARKLTGGGSVRVGRVLDDGAFAASSDA